MRNQYEEDQKRRQHKQEAPERLAKKQKSVAMLLSIRERLVKLAKSKGVKLAERE